MRVAPIEPISPDEVRAAAAVIADVRFATPVLRSDALDAAIGGVAYCKAEALQRAGSFKFRGAYHRLTKIPAADRERGVVAVSSGNHGAAVACAAELLGMPATVFVPRDTPTAKRALIDGFGATVQTFDRSIPDREAPARARSAATGATFVHPFEDRDVMLGQGTTALDLHEEVGPLDALLVPMSGGGLMAGCGSFVRGTVPECRLVGVEPERADDTRRSLAAGERVRIDPPDTIADGLALTMPGENTFGVNQLIVDEVVTVTEEQIVDAMRHADRHMGVRVEPSGAVGIAALLAESERWSGRTLGVVLSGGNIDDERFTELCGPR